MSAKLQNSNKPWADPDDAPELGDEFFEKGVWKIGDKVVSPEEAGAATAKIPARGPDDAKTVNTTIKVDADIVAAFKATGGGWEARMNDVLREWLKSRA